MPRGIAGSGTRVRNRGSTTAASNASTAATLAPTAASTSHQLKPLLGLSVQNYDFAIVNGTYQAVMQQGRAWVPVATIPAFIVAQWFMQKGILPPLGFASGSANGTGNVPSSTRSSGTQSKIATGNRV